MKKLLMLAVVAAFTATVIGCGPAPSTKKADPTPAAGGGDKPKEEPKKP